MNDYKIKCYKFKSRLLGNYVIVARNKAIALDIVSEANKVLGKKNRFKRCLLRYKATTPFPPYDLECDQKQTLLKIALETRNGEGWDYYKG